MIITGALEAIIPNKTSFLSVQEEPAVFQGFSASSTLLRVTCSLESLSRDF